jgi:hypothetical protein
MALAALTRILLALSLARGVDAAAITEDEVFAAQQIWSTHRGGSAAPGGPAWPAWEALQVVSWLYGEGGQGTEQAAISTGPCWGWTALKGHRRPIPLRPIVSMGVEVWNMMSGQTEPRITSREHVLLLRRLTDDPSHVLGHCTLG